MSPYEEYYFVFKIPVVSRHLRKPNVARTVCATFTNAEKRPYPNRGHYCWPKDQAQEREREREREREKFSHVDDMQNGRKEVFGILLLNF